MSIDNDDTLRRVYQTHARPSELLYRELVEEFGVDVTEYTLRCFELRGWKTVIGEYPTELDHQRALCLMGIEEEVSLIQMYQIYEMQQEQTRMKSEMQAKSMKSGAGSGYSNVPRNRF